jgi:hypothetical protein
MPVCGLPKPGKKPSVKHVTSGRLTLSGTKGVIYQKIGLSVSYCDHFRSLVQNLKNRFVNDMDRILLFTIHFEGYE